MEKKRVQKITDVLFYASVAILAVSLWMRYFGDILGNVTFFSLSLLGFVVFHLVRLIKFVVRKRTIFHRAYSIIFILMGLILWVKYLYHDFGHWIGLLVIPVFGLLFLHYFLFEKERDRRTSTLMVVFFILSVPLFTPKFQDAPLSYIPWWIEKRSTLEMEYFDNGVLKKRYEVQDGKKHGSIIEKYEDGQTKHIGWYFHGQPNRMHFWYYPNGKIKKECYLKEGKLDGVFKMYYKNEELKYKGRYENGKKEGKHKWFYSSGQLKNQVEYWKGKLHGESKKFYKNGEGEYLIPYKEGEIHGVMRGFHKNGKKEKVVSYRSGEKQGTGKFFYKDGSLKMKSFSRDDSTIFYKVYNKEGAVKDVFGTLNEDSDEKWKKECYMDTAEFIGDQSIKDEYKQCREYYPTDTLKKVLHYNSSGDLHGPYAEFYPNGEWMAEGLYRHGNKFYKFDYFRKDGSLWKREFWPQVKSTIAMNQITYYDRDGNIIEGIGDFIDVRIPDTISKGEPLKGEVFVPYNEYEDIQLILGGFGIFYRFNRDSVVVGKVSKKEVIPFVYDKNTSRGSQLLMGKVCSYKPITEDSAISEKIYYILEKYYVK